MPYNNESTGFYCPWHTFSALEPTRYSPVALMPLHEDWWGINFDPIQEIEPNVWAGLCDTTVWFTPNNNAPVRT